MKHLKIVSPGFEAYTGNIGPLEFKDGLSLYPVPAVLANRVTAAMRMVEVDVDSTEVEAGVAHKLVADSDMRAPVLEALKIQTEDDKRAEELAAQIAAQKAPVEVFYTRAELEAILSDRGMKGLREIGDKWHVKHRQAVILLEEILEAQAKFLAVRDLKLQEKAEAEKAAAEIVVEDATREPAQEEGEDRLVKAAQTGDMAAAITAGAAAEAEAGIEADAEGKSEDDADGTLLGSNVLASTYEIAGETVQLGQIVLSAFTLFGDTAEAWNALENDAREDLLRAELDRRLAAV